jgi:anti-anti-sigma factor
MAPGDRPRPEAGEEWFGRVFRDWRDGVVVGDPERDAILDANPAACNLLGYTCEELRSMPASALVPVGAKPRFLEFIDSVLERGAGWTDALTCQTKARDLIPCEVSASVVPYADRPCFLALLRDIGERKRAEADHARRLRYSRFLADVTAEFSAQRDLGRLFQAVAQRCTEILGDWCAFCRIDADRRDIRIEALYHADAAKRQRLASALESAPVRKDDPLIQRLLRERSPFVLSPEDPEMRGLIAAVPAAVEAFGSLGITAALSVPVTAGGEVIGLFAAGVEGPRRWDDDDLRLASLIADRTGIAIRNAEQYAAEVAARAEAQTARHQFALLADASRLLLASGLDFTSTLATVARLAVPAMGEACAVYVLEGRGIQAVSLGPSRGSGTEGSEGLQHRRSRQHVPPGMARVFETGQAKLYAQLPEGQCQAVAEDEDLLPFRGRGRISAMLVPLRVRHRVIGAIRFMSAAEHRRYDLSDLMTAQELAQRAALAIENARLYEAELATRRAAERLTGRIGRLQVVTARLAEALTVVEVARVLVEDGVAALGAKAALVALLTPDGSAIEVVRAVGYPGEVEGRRLPLGAPMPGPVVARTRAPLFVPSREALLERFPALRDAPGPLPEGARGMLPLLAGGETLGALTFVFPEPAELSDEDKAFMLTLATLGGQSLERSRRYEVEHRVAETLQRALLPARLPELPGVRFDAAYRPGSQESEVGGDWYDAFALPDGTIGVSIGDVAGRGLDAAVLMGQLRQSIRSAALIDPNPAAVLEHASGVLRENGRGRMATALFGVLDPVPLAFTFASAGHPPPLLATPRGEVQSLAGSGLPLGMSGPVRTTVGVSLPPGALLVMYTDGLVEVRRNFAEGEAALRAAVRSQAASAASEEPAQALLAALLGPVRPRDDAAVLIVSIAPALERFESTLPAAPASVREARHAYRRLAAAAGLPAERRQFGEIALGEAVNNAVEHAYGAAEGTVRVSGRVEGDALTLEVEDQGRWRPERSEARGHGRGLRLMGLLADTVDVTSTAEGTTVRLGLSLVGPPEPPGEASSPAVPGSPATTERPADGSGGGHARVPASTVRWTSHGAGLSVAIVDGVPVVDVAGEVDMLSAGPLVEAVTAAAGRDRGAVIVSLASVAYLDSQGVGALLAVADRLARNRQRLAIAVPPAHPVRRVLEVAGLVCDSAAAVEALGAVNDPVP